MIRARLLTLLSLPLLACPVLASAVEPFRAQVFRTFMPDAGPSAFAILLGPNLALCYDDLRGGVNQVWRGSIDLSPTFQAKINQPAAIRGTPFYKETTVQPVRIGEPSAHAITRPVVVPDPGEHWLEVTAALVDVLRVVVLRPPAGVQQRAASILDARLRTRSAVLVVQGAWPRVEARLSTDRSAWRGPGAGSGSRS